MNRRQIRRAFLVNAADNLVVRKVIGRPPLELFMDAVCPVCGTTLADTCGHFDKMTLDELAQKGFARYVEQV